MVVQPFKKLPIHMYNIFLLFRSHTLQKVNGLFYGGSTNYVSNTIDLFVLTYITAHVSKSDKPRKNSLEFYI